ncbi:hypothetical protein JG687_00016855, partial [Phytophthora cactorum]
TRQFSSCTTSVSLLGLLSYSGRVADALPRVNFCSVAHLLSTCNIQGASGGSHLAAPGAEQSSTARRRSPRFPSRRGV